MSAALRLTDFDELLTEAQALERYPLLLSPRELRGARQRAEIEWFQGKKGVVLYRPAELARYLSAKAHGVGECPAAGSGNTAATGSATPPAPKRSTPTGMTPEDAQRVAARLGQ